MNSLLSRLSNDVRARLAKAQALAWMEKRDESMALFNSIFEIRYEGSDRKDLDEEARRAASCDMESMIDSYSNAADGFSRLKRILGK